MGNLGAIIRFSERIREVRRAVLKLNFNRLFHQISPDFSRMIDSQVLRNQNVLEHRSSFKKFQF